MDQENNRQNAIEKRLASYSEGALTLARNSRPENTKRAYESKQREWKVRKSEKAERKNITSSPSYRSTCN